MKPGAALCLLLIVAAAALGCGGETLDPAPFLGTWRYASDASADCMGGAISVPLGGLAVTIRRGTGADLELEASCYCRFNLQLQAGYRAVAHGVQPCEQTVGSEASMSTVDHLSLTLSRAPSGDDSVAMEIGGTFAVQAAGVRTQCVTRQPAKVTLTRSAPSADCGPDDTAVGVPVYSPTDGLTDCVSEAGRDGVAFVLDDEDTHPPDFCTNETKDWKQGAWVAPNDVKNVSTCAAYRGEDTFLPFCRVDGRLFKAMTADPQATQQAYAVLKLGTACPNGSVEMKKTIDTEDQPVMNFNMPRGRLGPSNYIGQGPSQNSATLAFCYFTSAAAPEQQMTDFPDLGFHYAVFHDFDGPQPPWVLNKMWHYSDNEDNFNRNRYDPAQTNGFDTIIENVNNDTCFDMAHVR